jgi:hypothetical protein
MTKVNTEILRLKDILRAIEDIEIISLKANSSRTDLLATAYTIAIIGEAATRYPESLSNAKVAAQLII